MEREEVLWLDRVSRVHLQVSQYLQGLHYGRHFARGRKGAGTLTGWSQWMGVRLCACTHVHVHVCVHTKQSLPISTFFDEFVNWDLTCPWNTLWYLLNSIATVSNHNHNGHPMPRAHKATRVASSHWHCHISGSCSHQHYCVLRLSILVCMLYSSGKKRVVAIYNIYHYMVIRSINL